MKAFIFLIFVGFVSSDTLTDSIDVLERTLVDIRGGASNDVSNLKYAMKAPNSLFLDSIENDVSEYVMNSMRDHFYSTLVEASLKLAQADSTAEDLFHRISEFEKEFKELGSSKLKKSLVAKKMEKFLSKILGQNGTKLQDEVEEIMRKVTTPEKWEIGLKEKLSSLKVVKDIRSYVSNLPEEVEEDLGIPLKKLVKTLSNSDILNVIKSIIFSRHDRGIFDFFNKIKDFFHDLGVKISSKFSSFRDWAKGHWTSAMEKIKGKVGSFTALAKEFIANAKDITVAVAKQALAFFKEHKSEIVKFVFEKAIIIAIGAIAG